MPDPSDHDTGASGARSLRRRVIIGWIAVGVTVAIAGIWGFWGAIENFHEGWRWPGLARNLLGLLAYLGPMLLTIALGLLALRFPRFGAIVYVAIGGYLGGWFILSRDQWDFGSALIALLMGGFGGVFGILYWFGRPRPRKLAYGALVAIPLLIVMVSGAEPAWRVATRFDDGDRGMRLVDGNVVRLHWAPEGPGWPREGVRWEEAVARCRRLTADGLALADEPIDLWRLPTADEIVRSLTRHGTNAGGTWDESAARASYRVTPDKESPLWDPYSPIIYWWAANDLDPEHAYRVVYNGQVRRVRKSLGMGSQGFRAVRDAAND